MAAALQQDVEFLKLALILAEEAAASGEVPVGAVVSDPSGMQVLGRGRNHREADHDPCGHAEILALREAAQSLRSWRLESCTLFVTLEPCMMCLAAAQHARIARVVYGASDPKGGALSLGYRFHEDPRTNHRFQVDQVEMPGCGQILTQFFTARRGQKAES